MADRSDPAPPGPATEPDPLREFLAVMRRLQAEDPWKAVQTHRSLARYLLEETHEALEAIDVGETTGSWDDLRDELGDVLLQVYFHAVLAEQAGEFTLDDVARGVTVKMVHRNPHVFAPETVADPPRDAAAVDAAYQAIKQADRPRRTPVDGLPGTLPALLYATKAVERGLEPARAAVSDTDVGERLLALVAEASADGIDPEQALRDAVRRHLDPDLDHRGA